jgi:hypothetical protein
MGTRQGRYVSVIISARILIWNDGKAWFEVTHFTATQVETVPYSVEKFPHYPCFLWMSAE